MNYEMKKLKIYRASSTLSKPIADATHDISDIKFYIVEVETGEGITANICIEKSRIEGNYV